MQTTPTATSPPALRVEGLSKSFGATVAVKDASFTIQAGTVHALLGENGAGKSTIVKLLSGLLAPSRGHIEVFGASVQLRSPRDAHTHGIQTAFQEMTLVPDLTVLDNLLLPYAPLGRLGTIRRGAARQHLSEQLTDLGLDIDLNAEIGTLDLTQRQKIEIARAVLRAPRILLLDESTSTLAGKDVHWLGDLIARLRAQGVTIVFVSHRMREVRDFCDALSILRNGQHIVSAPVQDLSDAQVIERIVGRSLAQTFPARHATTQHGAQVLAVRNLHVGKARGVDFQLHQGEILGIAGLQGMGQQHVFHACFGMAIPDQGGILVDGQDVLLGSPADAIRANIGMGFVPEDRKTEGLFLKLDGRVNTTLAVVERFQRAGLIQSRAEIRATAQVFDQVQVDPRALWSPAGAFSGGNQQKIVLAKWLLARSRILLLFDPTRGIDVGTKHELYALMRQYVDQGGAILFYSTEIPEIVHLCDRALVLYDGRVQAQLQGDALSEPNIMRAALGEDAPRVPS